MGFTRLGLLGVWRYLRNVSEVIAHVFCAHTKQVIMDIYKHCAVMQTPFKCFVVDILLKRLKIVQKTIKMKTTIVNKLSGARILALLLILVPQMLKAQEKPQMKVDISITNRNNPDETQEPGCVVDRSRRS